MIDAGELGHFALIVAFVLACLQGTLPMGSWRGNSTLMLMAPAVAVSVFVFVLIAFGLLTAAFLQDDFQ